MPAGMIRGLRIGVLCLAVAGPVGLMARQTPPAPVFRTGTTAVPGSADLCFVWDGSNAELADVIAAASAEVIEGPVAREGGAGQGMSTYVRDPDGNLLEFILYG